MPNRRGLIVYSLGAVLAVLSIQFLTTLWAAREAREGDREPGLIRRGSF